MILRVVSGSTLRAIEIDDVSQVIVMAATGEPVALAHETPAGAIIVSQADAPDFDKTLTALGGKPVKVTVLKD